MVNSDVNWDCTTTSKYVSNFKSLNNDLQLYLITYFEHCLAVTLLIDSKLRSHCFKIV